MSNQPRAFISYARKDGEEIAKELFERLEKEAPGIALWWDRARMEGGKGWRKQIRDAIDQSKFLILVMTEGALLSETTRWEWKYARQEGVCVYPVMPEGSEIDFRTLPNWMRKAHFIDLEPEWDSFLQHLHSPCQATRVPSMAPDPPENLVVRSKEMDELIHLVLDGCQERKAISLCGAGGFGKTTLAAALCEDDRVIEAFDDGILWVTLGVNPDLRTELISLHYALTGEIIDPQVNLEGVAIRLSERLQDKRCLIVLDDVWEPAHVKPFFRGGKDCVRLITTRRINLAKEHTVLGVEEMTTSESLELLTDRLSTDETGLEPFRQLALRLGKCPLAMELANAALQERKARGSSLEDALKWLKLKLDKRGVTAFDALEKSIEVSLEFLDEEERLLLFQLATFPENTAAPRSAVQALWQMESLEADDLLMKLDDLALVKYNLDRMPVWPPKGSGWLNLHDILRDSYARRIEAVTDLRERLGLLTRVMPLNGFVNMDFFSYHRCAVDLCAEVRPALLPEDSCKTLGECWDQFVSEFDAPELWKTINKIDFGMVRQEGSCRVLGKLDVGLFSRGLFLADSGIRIDANTDPVKTLNELDPELGARSQNFILLTNTTAKNCLCYVEYFNSDGCVVLGFLIPFPARNCIVFNVFDSTIMHSCTNVSQRFFGVVGISPMPIPAGVFGNGQFLISIKTLRDDTQSLLILGLNDSYLGLPPIEEHYAQISTESLEEKLVRINNLAVGHARWHGFDTADFLLREALQLAAGHDEYASIIRWNLEMGLRAWRMFAGVDSD